MATTQSWHLGQTSAYYESGGSGPGTISSGVGDYGGVSYGTYQLSTNSGTLNEFLSQSSYAEKFNGLDPGTPAFNSEWRKLGRDDVGFAQEQYEFIKRTHYDVQAQSLKNNGLDLTSRGPAVQDALWSTSVQFRSLTPTIFKKGFEEKFGNAYSLSDLTDKDIVDAVQDYKINHNESLFSHSRTQWSSLVDRATNEKMDLEVLADGISPDPSNHLHTSHAPHRHEAGPQASRQSSVLRQGVHGDRVEDVQIQLHRLGYLHAIPNGRFGPATKGAVENFQRDQGVDPDGRVGPITQGKIDAALCERSISGVTLGEGPRLRDFSEISDPQNPLYRTLAEGFPAGTAAELLTQATASCYMSGIKGPDELGNVYGNGERIFFSSNSPLGASAMIDTTKPPPSVHQTMQQIQQHDQQQTQMLGQSHAQNAPVSQQGSQGPTPGLPLH